MGNWGGHVWEAIVHYSHDCSIGTCIGVDLLDFFHEILKDSCVTFVGQNFASLAVLFYEFAQLVFMGELD